MATTSIRWALTRHMVDRLAELPALSAVEVWDAWPGEKNVSREMMYVDELAGALNIPVSEGANNRHSRDDMFDIVWLTRIATDLVTDPRTGLRAVGDRHAVIVGVLEDWLADDPSIDEFDGVVSAEITDARSMVGMTPEGPMAFGQLTVSVHSRLN